MTTKKLMSATQDIERKHQQLRTTGAIDLGRKVGLERDGGGGGRYQEYERGRIYWHPSTGAREVHGGILTKYLENGGAGNHPVTGRPELGYPVTDEMKTADGRYPVSKFQKGAIYWIRGTGGVVIYGSLYDEWKRNGSAYPGNPEGKHVPAGELGILGLPLTSILQVADGEAVFFERGCLWKSSSIEGAILISRFKPPLLGCPKIINPTVLTSCRLKGFVYWWKVKQEHYHKISITHPGLFAEIWRNRFALQLVASANAEAEQIPLLQESVSNKNETESSLTIELNLLVPSTGRPPLKDGALYNLALRLSDKKSYIVSAHSFYAKDSWDDFGFIHATDLHVSRRLESFRDDLAKGGAAEDGIDQYNNFNDNWRDLIKYSNRLHEIGLLDFLILTGDLVDYGFERSDPQLSGGNYHFFKELVCGETGKGEELRVPVFTVMGNHDYRINPYALLFEANIIPLVYATTIGHYKPHNLTEPEAMILQGGKKLTLSPADALKMVKIDIFNQTNSYNYYLRHINAEMSYAVELGPHRLLMLDTAYDLGIPTTADRINNLLNYKFDWSEDESRAKEGIPNSFGIREEHLTLLRRAIAATGSTGLVIVGMHAPPLNIENDEYPHYLRETEHPTANPEDVVAFLKRSTKSMTDLIETSKGGWRLTGTTFFKEGTLDPFLDYGIARGKVFEFLKMCAGADNARSVDVVLCGHHHDHVEYRIQPQADGGQLEFYMDFYTENPTAYYSTTANSDIAQGEKRLPKGAPIFIDVLDGTSPNEVPTVVEDTKFSPPPIYGRLKVPPYVRPLNSSLDPRGWWQRHRPIILQTAAVGPLEARQRIVPRWRLSPPIGGTLTFEGHAPDKIGGQITKLPPAIPGPTFQGCRLASVRANLIQRIHHVSLPELRRQNFRLPFERDLSPVPRSVRPPPPRSGVDTPNVIN